MADGTLSHRPEGAVAVWLADPGSASLGPGSGKIIAVQGVTGFGSRSIDASGWFMDYDAARQDAANILTRGMLVQGCDGTVAQRYYVNVYPALSGATTLGNATRGSTTACGAGRQGR
jgi:hypothetical protein